MKRIRFGLFLLISILLATASITWAGECEVHYFGETGTQYYIYSDGRSWDFDAENDLTVNKVEVGSRLASYGGTFYIQVKINGSEVASWDQYVGSTTYQFYTHSADVDFNLNVNDTITYHIYGGTFSNPVGGIADAENYVTLCEAAAVSENATVIGTLFLPAEANGKEYVVIVDNDTDGDNGWIAATVGTCGSGTTVSYSINDVPAGTYYVYAVVRIVSDHDSSALPGDYIGFYGTGSDPPAQANAVVPSSGTVILDITLSIWNDGDGDGGGSGGGGGGCFIATAAR